MTVRPRPISPHLSIYRFTITMTMSIVHRITGAANYIGTLLLVVWLLAAAIGGTTYEVVSAVFGSWFGQLVLFGYTWSLFHHMLGGVRYFIWDSIHGLDAPTRNWLAAANLVMSVLLTLAAWSLFVWFK